MVSKASSLPGVLGEYKDMRKLFALLFIVATAFPAYAFHVTNELGHVVEVFSSLEEVSSGSTDLSSAGSVVFVYAENDLSLADFQSYSGGFFQTIIVVTDLENPKIKSTFVCRAGKFWTKRVVIPD